MNGLTVAAGSFAALLLAFGVIWRMAIKPIVEGVRKIVDIAEDVRDLVTPDDEGRSLPQRMAALEVAMADFLNKLGPMVEAIALLASRRTYQSKGKP